MSNVLATILLTACLIVLVAPIGNKVHFDETQEIK
jgi:hypothetical protein|tara:strand:+ start:265 stop:369 length:105 start_codon:yes stop_codon:yes gene_type:complete